LNSDKLTQSELLDALYKWMAWAKQHSSLIGDHRQFREIYRITNDILIRQELTQGAQE